MQRILFAVFVSFVWVVASHTGVAHALSSGEKQFINGDNTFYVYVKAGEKLSASFVRSQYYETGITGFRPPRVDVTITIDGPGIKQEKCIAKKDVPIGKGCVFSPTSAGRSGVWRINFMNGKGSESFPQGDPDIFWGKNLFSWNIDVTGSGNSEQHGRIWMDRYALRQPPKSQGIDSTGTFTYYYVSEDGYIYKEVNYQYNGIVSVLSADSIGIRKGNECTSAYKSTEVSDKDYSPALGSCGNRYKLFFEEPAGDLPESATRWDATDDWIRPNISRPSLSELHFTSNNSPDQQSGTISFFLHNFIGQYDIKIDVDNDGSFDGQSDVTLHEQMKQLSNGLQHVYFQGVDRQGQVIPTSQKIGIKVVITKVAEIHFVATDVEGRNGVQVTRLNGDNAPTTSLCWNDTELIAIADSDLTTPIVDGRSCQASDGGVHGWAFGSNSWGDARYIDDWIYALAKFDGNNQIVYPEDATKVAQKTQTNWVAIGLLVFGVIVVGAVVVIVIVRRGGKTPPAAPPAPPGVQTIGSQDPMSGQPQDQDRY